MSRRQSCGYTRSSTIRIPELLPWCTGPPARDGQPQQPIRVLDRQAELSSAAQNRFCLPIFRLEAFDTSALGAHPADPAPHFASTIAGMASALKLPRSSGAGGLHHLCRLGRALSEFVQDSQRRTLPGAGHWQCPHPLHILDWDCKGQPDMLCVELVQPKNS